MSASTDRCPLRLRTIAAAPLVAAAIVLALLVVPSDGAVPKQDVVRGAGMTEPAGVVRTPDGGIWVTDHLKGVCKVDLGAGPGNGQGLVPSDYCGLTHVGPTEAAGMTFDPVTSNFYVAEASSAAGGVWRLHLNTALEPNPGVIASAVKIADTPGDRVLGVALARTGNLADPDPANDSDVYFTTKRSTTVFRVTEPQAGGLHSTIVAGFTSGGEVASLAANGTTMYLAELTGITQLDLAAAVPEPATPLFGSPVSMPGGVPTAVAVDPARGRLYAGTGNENGIDQVDVINIDPLSAGFRSVEAYSLGFSGILAIHVDPGDGDLLVSDDPGLASGGITQGAGRIFEIPFGATGQSAPVITVAPDNFTNQQTATFEFQSDPGAVFECRIDGADADPFSPCTSPVVLSDVVEGAHTFDVRVVGTSQLARRTWVVDLTAPVIAIDGSQQEFQGDEASLRFSANESHVAFECSLDGAVAEPCDSPFRAQGLALGEHTLTVTGADPAGNAATPARLTFRMVPRPPTNSGSGSGGGGDISGSRADTPGDPRVTPVIVLRARAATLSRTRVRRSQLTSRPLGIAFNSHETARYARITIQPYHRGTAVLSRSRRPRIVASLLAPIQGGQRNYIRWRLTRRQAQRLTPGRYRVTVALGATRNSFGPQKLLTLRVIGNG